MVAKKRLPKYRDITIRNGIYLWLDDRDGASALVNRPSEGVSRDDLTWIFKLARQDGTAITARRPLIVYGTVCPVGETSSFRFIQMAPSELGALTTEVRSSAGL